MKIHYAQNPSETIIELTEDEKTIFRLKHELVILKEDTFSAWFHLTNEHYKDIDRAISELNPDKHEDEKYLSWLNECFEDYLESLSQSHVGDCTCVPCSCSKCHAETILGIDTIKGLGKHQHSKIVSAFKASGLKTCSEVIIWMENNPPIAKEDWHKPHIERWTQEHNQAIEWLRNYKSEFLTS